MTNDPRELQAELERLQTELASRASTTHFAHTGVSLIASTIFASAAVKLFIDSAKVPYLAFAAVLVSVGLAGYALVQLLRGRTRLAKELEQFAELQAVRHALQLDDPASLLPRA